MALDFSNETEHDVPGGHLLVRDAAPEDHAAVLDLLGRAGWAIADPDVWARGCRAFVLYDPADGVVRGAASVEGLVGGSFQLAAWAVEDVADEAEATARLVRAAADRLRRSGGERLVVTLDPGAIAVGVMADAGFGPMPFDPNDPGLVLTLYQEL